MELKYKDTFLMFENTKKGLWLLSQIYLGIIYLS